MSEHLYKEIYSEFGERLDGGLNIDSRLLKSVMKKTKSSVEKLTIDDPEIFLNLQFHDNPSSRLLTPLRQSRTLKDCVNRIVSNGWTFDKLRTGLELDSDIHNPKWFDACYVISEQFDYAKLFSIFLLPLTSSERSSSPLASYSLFDGTHKSLVLAYKLITQGLEFHPVNAYLFGDRDLLIH